MDFKRSDIVKIKKEVLNKVKRQKSMGKTVDGWWLPFPLIEAGRRDCEFEVIEIIGAEMYVKWKNKKNENSHYWAYKGYFELKGIVEAEDW